MDIDNYLIQGEKIKDRVSVTETGGPKRKHSRVKGSEWDWFITSERVIKYGEGNLLSGEEMHDLSLDKITGISFGSQRQLLPLPLGLVSLLIGFIFSALPYDDPIGILSILGGVFITFGIALILLWYFSKTPYLWIRSADSSEVMKMEVDFSFSSTGSNEVRSFVNTLREEMN
jgi:hypothetical protein